MKKFRFCFFHTILTILIEHPKTDAPDKWRISGYVSLGGQVLLILPLRLIGHRSRVRTDCLKSFTAIKVKLFQIYKSKESDLIPISSWPNDKDFFWNSANNLYSLNLKLNHFLLRRSFQTTNNLMVGTSNRIWVHLNRHEILTEIKRSRWWLIQYKIRGWGTHWF